MEDYEYGFRRGRSDIDAVLIVSKYTKSFINIELNWRLWISTSREHSTIWNGSRQQSFEGHENTRIACEIAKNNSGSSDEKGWETEKFRFN